MWMGEPYKVPLLDKKLRQSQRVILKNMYVFNVCRTKYKWTKQVVLMYKHNTHKATILLKKEVRRPKESMIHRRIWGVESVSWK